MPIDVRRNCRSKVTYYLLKVPPSDQNPKVGVVVPIAHDPNQIDTPQVIGERPISDRQAESGRRIKSAEFVSCARRQDTERADRGCPR